MRRDVNRILTKLGLGGPRRFAGGLALALLGIGLGLLALAPAPPPRIAAAVTGAVSEDGARVGETVTGTVRMSDADTLRVDGVRVRLHGIDAVETDQTCTSREGREWSCGRWAAEEAKRLFDGTAAACAVRDVDRYGRAVASCRIAGADMGAELVSRGLAVAYERYSDAYVAAEEEARRRGAGLFAGRVEDPALFRARQRAETAAANAPPDPGCAIKGNVSATGRIYHVPGQSFYGRTRIEPEKGERWFCSEDEAEAAGWRASRI